MEKTGASDLEDQIQIEPVAKPLIPIDPDLVEEVTPTTEIFPT